MNQYSTHYLVISGQGLTVSPHLKVLKAHIQIFIQKLFLLDGIRKKYNLIVVCPRERKFS